MLGGVTWLAQDQAATDIDRARSAGCVLPILPSLSVAETRWNVVIMRAGWPSQCLLSLSYKYHLTCLLSSLAPSSLLVLYPAFTHQKWKKDNSQKTQRWSPENPGNVRWKTQKPKVGSLWICISLRGDTVYCEVRSRLNNFNFPLETEILFMWRKAWITKS